MTQQAQDHRVTLYFCQGGSDKVYQAAVEPQGTGFIVTFAFGRRGSTLQTGTKTPQPVSFDAARKILDKLVKEKMAKGYTPGAEGVPYQHTEREERATGVLPQLLNPIDEAEAEKLITDDRWWMQEKFDGKRILIRKHGDQITAINRTGLTVGLPETIIDGVRKLRAKMCLLDGEAMGEMYHAFDLLEIGQDNLRSCSYYSRFMRLVDLVDPAITNSVRYAPTAIDAKDKRAMLQRLRQTKMEGVVFKRHDAPYAPGRPASGGTQLKLKFYATASCIVAGVNGSKRSVALELVSDNVRVPVGNVTIPLSHAIPAKGDVVETRYLYAYHGGSLYQPVYLGRREDVSPAACTTAQLKLKPGGA